MTVSRRRKSLDLWIFLNLVGLLAVPLVLTAEKDFVEETPFGKIYWSRGLVVAAGKGVTSPNTVNLALSKAMAEKAAIKDARINLLHTVKMVRLDAANTVGTLMVQNDKYKDEITVLVQKAPPWDIKYKSDSTVEVWAMIKLYGPLADFYFRQGPASSPKAETSKNEPPKAGNPLSISGVIVDARGLKVKPALAPKIYDENGKEILRISQRPKEVVSAQGVAVYLKDPAFARVHPRAGEAPYLVKAVRASGPEKVDLVISNSDAQVLLSASENQSFFVQGRVIILLD